MFDELGELAPEYTSLPYYRALFNREFTYGQTMQAHLQDLARSVGTQGLREIQLDKLQAEVEAGFVTVQRAERLREVIEDELPGEGREGHLAVRLQIFDGLPYTPADLMSVQPVPEGIEAIRVFRDLFERRSLLEITAAVGSIEQWYVPLAERLEAAYLELGYTTFQVGTYTLHKSADVEHSGTALGFVSEDPRTPRILDRIREAVIQGFSSVRLFDLARSRVATDASRSFESYLRLDPRSSPAK